MTDQKPLHLFEGYGIELEYMIVDRERLDVMPVCDRLIEEEAGEVATEIEVEDIAWSNELVLHVIEFKTNGPVPTINSLAQRFQDHIHRASMHLKKMNARIMPTAMHPWMDPHTQTKLWPHEYGPVYKAFDRIFGCKGHGWANLQSMHINLPFCGDEEFGRLHAAVRLVLPILPAIAASSPIRDGQRTGVLDSRLEAYRRNCARVPMVSGRVIPEPVFSIADYRERILGRLYQDMAPLDPEGTLRDEWLNARGAIARFGRGSIEIRVIDVQECPVMDLAIAALAIETVKQLAAEAWSSSDTQRAFTVDALGDVFDATVRDADQATISDATYLRALGCEQTSITAGALWKDLAGRLSARAANALDPHLLAIDVLLNRGPLARRILHALDGAGADHATIKALYERLCDCLDEGVPFV